MHRRRPLSAVVALALAVAAPFVLLGTPASAAPAAAKPYDFNGDGYPELVVGASSLLTGTDAEGGFAVFAASRKGLSTKAQVFDAAALGLSPGSYGRQGLGSGFASGDFDGDGYADLAVARPVATRTYAGAGAVTVLYGSAQGLETTGAKELLQPGGPSDDVRFGSSIVAADLNGDGRADLAVGAPYAEFSSSHAGEGTVSVFLGGAKGLSDSRSSVLRGNRGDAFYEDYFGTELAVGDLDQDGRPDLVVGSRGPDSVSVCYGTAGAPNGCAQLTKGAISDQPYSLAVGNVSQTSRPEVVVGSGDFDDPSGSSGSVRTLSLSGPRASTTVTQTVLTQDSPGVRGTAEPGDRFGEDLVLGDLDHDGYDDLVVGAPGEDKEKGRVTVVYGGAAGYRTSGGRVYDQNTRRIPGKAEKKDAFGTTVALLDHDADGHLDLSVGAPGEDDFSGAVTLVRGAGRSFTTKKARTVTLKKLGVENRTFAGFGDALGR